MGYSWQVALMAVFIEGIIFIVLSLTNVREAIFNAIPATLKKGVSAGIGLFIAIKAINSEFVGFPFPEFTVYPKSSSIASNFPRLQATSMAWRIALSTRLGVV